VSVESDELFKYFEKLYNYLHKSVHVDIISELRSLFRDPNDVGLLTWPMFDSENQRYIQLNTNPEIRQHYEPEKMNAWLQFIGLKHEKMERNKEEL